MKDNVPERAAMPKIINIVDEMPLTAVGKMFKPELVCREIKQVISLVLAEKFSEEKYQITVKPDKKHGIIATINVETFTEQVTVSSEIKALLADYSFHYHVVCTDKILSE